MSDPAVLYYIGILLHPFPNCVTAFRYLDLHPRFPGPEGEVTVHGDQPQPLGMYKVHPRLSLKAGCRG